MNIYNSVLLDHAGIIQQVHTSYPRSCTPVQPVERFITLYAFSFCVEDTFRSAFLPFRFYVDEGQHTGLQEVILAGSHFVHPRGHPFYAELVIAFGEDETEIETILRQVLHDGWKVMGWRKATICDNKMIGISLRT